MVRQFEPNDLPAKRRIAFHTSELMKARNVVFQNDRFDIPAKNAMTARVPARKRFTITTR
jgi:hypothetical protein